MTTYLIYLKGQIEVEAENKEEAQEKATKIIDSYKDFKVEEAKVADKKSGYFIE